jgi:cytoskeleton protein RodZ
MSPPDADIAELPSSPGARLRREREARGMSQQLAAETLNLDPMVVTSLESNDCAALGAPVFVRGHLRRYAGMLGLAEDEIVTMYERPKQQVDEPSLVPKSRLEMAPVRGKPRWPWVVGGLVTFLVAAALVAYVSANGLPWVAPATEDEPQAQVLQDVPAAAVPSGAPAMAAPVNGDVPPAANAPDAAAQSAAAATTAPAGSAPVPATLQSGQVSLQLRFSTDSWVEVFDGSGKAVLYDLGKAGSERTITADAPLSVTLGNAPGVVVVVNGRTLPPPPRAVGQMLARFSVGPDGSLR